MLVGFRPPAEIALCNQKGFCHERATRCNRVDDSRPTRTVQIVEYQHQVERAEVRPVTLEIDGLPVDLQPALFCSCAACFETVVITIDGNDLGPAFGGCETVTPFTASDVENRGSLPEQEVVPREPNAGWRNDRRRWNGH